MKQDTAAKIGADWHRDNPPLAALLAIKIREAVNEETERCQALIMEYHRQQLDKPARHQAFVCDDLASLIGTTPKPKRKARK
jgi:hypothetical protein